MQTRFDLLITVFAGLAIAPLAVASPSPSAVEHFEKHVRPLLEAKCLKCHGANKQEGDLRLDSRASVFKGGESGPAIVARHPKTSLLIEAVNYESLEMPPDGQLSGREIEHLTAWIADGAAWPDDTERLREASGPITDADRQWWAFQPFTTPAIPSDSGDDWSRNPIDRFVLRRLSEEELQPAPRADRVTLVRRAYFDLIGLPPTPEEIDTYLGDDAPDAWNRLIDKLLADSRYGEHWARFWLDLVRYAESDGWKADGYRSHMWRYRDYVVGAFNEDKPYPRFVREQLAGDEMPGDDPSALAAAGFLRLGIYEYNQRDARAHWNDIINEITDVTGDVFLGLGVACARCHDHKFDPVLQQDYFQLRAFFEPLLWRDTVTVGTDEQTAERENQQAAWIAATQDLRAQFDELVGPYQDRVHKTVVEKFPLEIQACITKPPVARTSWDHQMAYLMQRQVADEGGGPRKVMPKKDRAAYDRLKQELAKFDHLKPAPSPVVMTVADAPGEISPTIIPLGSSGTAVAPGFLSVLANELTSAEPTSAQMVISAQEDSSGRRSALAAWIGRADNPLTTRVIVNRIWQQHFGKGIVATTNDFGRLGQLPTHPELLDWLTVTFIERGWSMKDLHRLMLTSATWQQSAHHPQAVESQQRDPAGDLLWRAPVRRLKAEQIRDAMLRATGELERGFGGPSVDSASPRRSLYVKVYRNTPDEFLHAFDMANALKSVAARIPTTTPTQSLLMINGGYTLARAEVLATRLTENEQITATDLLQKAFRRTWGRPPSSRELSEALAFVGTTADQDAPSIDRQQLTDFCHVLLNANPFLYVD